MTKLVFRKEPDAFQGFEDLPASTRLPIAALALRYCEAPLLTNEAMQQAYDDAEIDFEYCIAAFGQTHLFVLIAEDMSSSIGVGDWIDDDEIGKHYLLDDDQLEDLGQFLATWTPFERHGAAWVKIAAMDSIAGSSGIRFE